MIKRFWIIIVLFFPSILFGQNPIPDTLRDVNSHLKSSGNYILETTAPFAYTIVINEILAINSDFNIDDHGDDDDWFEIYNYGEDSINIADLWFTDDNSAPYKWRINTVASIYIQPNDHMVFWADGETEQGYNHASFKLSGDGEYLAIYSNDGTLIDEIFFIGQTPNISFGRASDGGVNWSYFSIPSPGVENNDSGGQGVLPQPTANLEGGIFVSPFLLSLHTSTAGSEIRFTIDCTEPDQNSLLYSNAIQIESTTIIRAKAVKEGDLDSPTLTLSFIFEPNQYDNPIISIVSEPENLFGTNGVMASNTSKSEIHANFEYFISGQTAFSSGTGIQVHASGAGDPNSLRLYARSRYGNSWFTFPFFNEEGPDAHKRLILRNSGNDNVNSSYQKTHMRDPLGHKIARSSNTNPLVSASRVVNVYLNGEYYGIYNLRERIDEYYIEAHSSANENFDFIERAFGYKMNTNVICGTIDNWIDILTFADTTGDLTKTADFQYIEENVDIPNFTDYWITEVFLGNYDWLSNNIKFWKPENGKWQWIYWDLDHGLGLPYGNYGNYQWNTLAWSLGFSDRAWPNGYNNILIRNLLENQAYKKYFIDRYSYLLNTELAYNSTKLLLDEMRSTYHDDMVFHAQRWENDINNWISASDVIDNFLKFRPSNLFAHLQNFFDLEDPVHVSIDVQPPGAGVFYFGSVEITNQSYEGKHFPGTFEIKTKPIPGYTLYKILINNNSTLDPNYELTDSTEITVIFKPEEGQIPLEFHEIFFNNRKNYDCGDWIELYYYGNSTIDLSGYELFGANDELLYTFEEGVIIDSNTFFVVTEDSLLFKDVFTKGIRHFGNISSGFSDRLNFKLLSEEGELQTEIDLGETFNIASLPEEGYSYGLFISEQGQSWEISSNQFGSPGIPNTNYYHFHPPNGKDTVFSNRNSVLIEFESSEDFYSDVDEHEPAKIYVNSVSGPGLTTDGSSIEGNTLYDVRDFIFEPTNQFKDATLLSYSFIDRSGEMSSGNTIRFRNPTGLNIDLAGTIKQYPSPAQDFCFIELDGELIKNLHFTLLDISGKIIQKIDSEYNNRISIDLSGVNAGIYFYLIHSNNNIYNGKIEVIK